MGSGTEKEMERIRTGERNGRDSDRRKANGGPGRRKAEGMAGGYRVLWKGGQGELTEKRSRFIATTAPAASEEEALAFVERTRKKYRDARHNCYAYVIGERGQFQKCSDDGEPAQTAGRPILDVLLAQEVRDACVVVTRYFGGVLLGTGGLVRAYSGAAREGLSRSVIVEKRPGRLIAVAADYGEIGRIQSVLARRKMTVTDTAYTDSVIMKVLVPEEEADSLMADITEGTGGRARISPGERVCFGVADGNPVLL